MPDDFEGLAACYSPGVAGSSSFEREFADRDIKCFLADYSVDAPAEENKNFVFEKKYLGASTAGIYIRLEDWVNKNTPEADDLLLQMDIEGAEYEIILDTPRQTLARFRTMVIEFHSLEMLFARKTLPFMKQVFSKLLEDFVIVHVHPNNCCPIKTYEGIDAPPVMEFTFHRKDRFTESSEALSFPHKMDVLNVPQNPEIILPPLWQG